MRRKNLILVVLVVVALFIGGCGDSQKDQKVNQQEQKAVAKTTEVSKTKDLTREQIVAEIQKEGEVSIANWTYTANDKFTEKFKEYILNEYGVNIQVNYHGSQEPGTYLLQIEKALETGNPSPYDVVAVEENYLHTAITKNLASSFLPSSIVPNTSHLSKEFINIPYGLGFQSTATMAVVYNKDRVNFLKDWKDIADPKLKGKIALPEMGDIASGTFIASLAKSLGLSIESISDVEKAIDFAVNEIGPNVLKYTTSSSELQSLMRSGTIDACVTWNSFARFEVFEGNKNTAILLPESGMIEINGYAWIPNKAKHPILAQLFVNFEISKDRQLPPDSWNFTKAEWMEFHEGLVGKYYEDFIPEWLKDNYHDYYLTMEEISKYYYKVDWSVFARDMKQWMKLYEEKLKKNK